jgi:hypothetical protein
LISETEEERMLRLQMASAVISDTIATMLAQGTSPDRIKMMFYEMIDAINEKKEERMN